MKDYFLCPWNWNSIPESESSRTESFIDILDPASSVSEGPLPSSNSTTTTPDILTGFSTPDEGESHVMSGENHVTSADHVAGEDLVVEREVLRLEEPGNLDYPVSEDSGKFILRRILAAFSFGAILTIALLLELLRV